MRRFTLLATAAFLLGTHSANAAEALHKRLYAVPKPGPITIDGNLADWDLSGAIEIYVVKDTRAVRNANFAVMYDDDAMYLGAHVKDSTPMMNRYDPLATADKAWQADVCQFRMVTDGTLDNAASLNQFDKTKEQAQPVHLQLWYYTDGKVPALQVSRGFNYKPGRADWAPHGTVPRDLYQGAYVMDADGQGYTFEYRIPWSTLDAEKIHPRAGQQVPGTVQFNWGDATGLQSAGGGWAYEVMSKPGFPFQTADVWGNLIFSPTGHIPASASGAKPEPPLPLTFDYTLPKDAEVTLAIYGEGNRLVRNIVGQETRTAGAHHEKWDGLDENGDPVPAGTYTWRGIYHDPLKTKYIASIGNSGQPGWKTADGSGGWGGDYGPPTAICAAHNMLVMGWTGGEAGPPIIGTDLDGKKKWGLAHKQTAYLATDGTRFFAPAELGVSPVLAFEVASGKPMPFGNGASGLVAPPGAAKPEDNTVTGLSWQNGRLFVSYAARNLVAVFDSNSGKLITAWNVISPGRSVGDGKGGIYFVSGRSVVHANGEGNAVEFIANHLDEPAGIANDVAGNFYVSNGGKLQNVSVFSPQGKYLKSIGKAGGRPRVGKFDPNGMLCPAGIAVDKKGQLWVPESILSPKRVSVWDTGSGKLIRDYFGSCSYSPALSMDPANPTEVFHDNNIWKINLNTGEWRPYSTFYRPDGPNGIQSGDGGFFSPFRVLTADNGKQYGFSEVRAFGNVLWLREGDRFRPLIFTFKNRPNHVLMNVPPFDFMQDMVKYPAGANYAWVDANADETAQESEIQRIPDGNLAWFGWVDKKLRLWGRGHVWQPVSTDKKGVPTYDFTRPRKEPALSNANFVWTNGPGDQVFSFQTGSKAQPPGVTRWDPDFGPMWSTARIAEWRDSLNFSQLRHGPLFGATCGLGTAGDFTGVARYFGFTDILRQDGMYVGRIFKPNLLGENGPDVLFIEFLYGQMVKPDGMNRYFILGGDQDARITEVLGLDTIKDLSGGTYTISPEEAQKVNNEWAAYKVAMAGNAPLTINPGGLAALKQAEPVGKTVQGGLAFEASATYDKDNLYVHYDVRSPAPLINGIADPQVIFKGGNLLDIQLATNPAADPNRKRPAAGDVRLLISRQNGAPYTVIFRPVVPGATEPVTLTSPTGKEKFDLIQTTNRVELRDYQTRDGGFAVTAVVPLDLLSWKPVPGGKVKLDLGYIFGTTEGTQAVIRSYWSNNGFSANVVNDIPNESRLEPQEWDWATVK